MRKPKKRRGWKIVLIIILALVGMRLALPYVLKWQFEQRMAASGTYRGTVGDIDLNLWRGAYEVEELRVEKAGGNIEDPFFTVQKLDFSVDWSSLLDGAFVAEATLHQPVLNYVKGPDTPSSQTEPPQDWKQQMQDMFPIRFDRIEVRDGTVTYKRSQEGGPTDMRLTELNGVVRNITNKDALSGKLPASLDASATALDTGRMRLHVNLDPFAKVPTFDLDAKFANVELAKMGGVLRPAANLDVEGGVFDASVDIRAADGKFKGTVRPFFENVTVVKWREEGTGSGVFDQLLSRFEKRANELLLGGEGSYSAKIPVSGTFEEGEGVVETMTETLRAALIKGLMSGLQRAAEERFGS
jgi:hypothetical protein